MSNGPVPYNLQPKRTKLPAGHDESLDPAVPPTDAEQRGLPVWSGPRVDASKGSDRPPDAPIAPPAVDSARRSVPAFTWPTAPAAAVPGRAMRETMGKVPGTLDPDIALWQAIVVSIWPFTGPPTEGEFPKGWLGVDNTSAIWVCTVAGEPGTWVELGAVGPAGGWPTNNGSGAGNLEAETGSGDTIGYKLHDQGSGGIALQVSGTGQLILFDNGAEGIQLSSTGSDGIEISANDAIAINTSGGPLTAEVSGGSGALEIANAGTGGIAITPGSGGMTAVLSEDAGSVTDVSVPDTGTTIVLTTASLAVGKWLVSATGFANLAASGEVDIVVAEATATATFAGGTESNPSIGAGGLVPFALNFVATVTVAGTIKFNATSTPSGNSIDLLGYTALRIA